MSRRKKDPLRPLTDDELSSLTHFSRSQKPYQGQEPISPIVT